jgi:hypothetical protein
VHPVRATRNTAGENTAGSQLQNSCINIDQQVQRLAAARSAVVRHVVVVARNVNREVIW